MLNWKFSWFESSVVAGGVFLWFFTIADRISFPSIVCFYVGCFFVLASEALWFFIPPLRMDLCFHPPIKKPSDARCITKAEAFAFFSSAVADGFKLSSSDQKTFWRPTVWFFPPCVSPQLGLHFEHPPLRKENYFIPRWKSHPVSDIFFSSHVWASNIYLGMAFDFLLLFSRCQALSPSSRRRTLLWVYSHPGGNRGSLDVVDPLIPPLTALRFLGRCLVIFSFFIHT